ncbi:hypothetical protein BEI_1909 [Halomonas beimenensis]|uniref:Uncharacterized protein n=1 Tax=Halomonas beimenensis TaxID=475662 RepID=A0A291P7L7_9GAMM|nr:hypothetical protein BEI_1909 [Halomonas beimenensis]
MLCTNVHASRLGDTSSDTNPRTIADPSVGAPVSYRKIWQFLPAAGQSIVGFRPVTVAIVRAYRALRR